MCSIKLLISVALISIIYVSIIETCGNVETSTTVGRKKRSIVETAQVEFTTIVDFDKSHQTSTSNNMFRKIEHILTALNYDMILSYVKKTEPFEKDDKLGLKYNLENVDCHEVLKFAQATKDTVSFIEKTMVTCDGQLIKI